LIPAYEEKKEIAHNYAEKCIKYSKQGWSIIAQHMKNGSAD